MTTRCDWAVHNPLEQEYHDNEWGIPLFDDQKLFELLILESMQAGLSWSTILAKRETLTEAYSNWNYQEIAAYTDENVERLLVNPGVIRHKLKIKSTISNAQAFIAIQNEFGSFSHYLWDFVDDKPINNNWSDISEVPAKTELSDKISKDLKKRGFKFLGSTTVYAYMQAIGLVNDHLLTCFKK
ncbi:DNA-3-methyladenine glycosylase [Vagococcus penaei]|uniref:DNA-3-methyladenine glycosylase n=1 Tax=Vagococcus penaei TaxID=633807 RepID=A0A1Q2D6I8_9ENTE|nr:DNA-3-methyladenine glycosylase I [Vagococcus penaei]AQP53927.1 DNA-3-methyladenine glycosylase [Vagococcus penaei]RSU02909.1 DNA-3-methyladenine glycosylase [Vagococcus penaei]